MWRKICQLCQFRLPGSWIFTWSLNIVQNTFNDYIWSYMIATDISACVLTCYRIFDNFQDKKLMIEIDILLVSSTKKLSKMCQIYRFCPLLNPECPIWSLHIMSRHIQWLSIVIYNGNWYISMCFYLLWDLWWSLGQKFPDLGAFWAIFSLFLTNF